MKYLTIALTVAASVALAAPASAGNQYGGTVAASCLGDVFAASARGENPESPDPGLDIGRNGPPAPGEVSGAVQTFLDGQELVDNNGVPLGITLQDLAIGFERPCRDFIFP